MRATGEPVPGGWARPRGRGQGGRCVSRGGELEPVAGGQLPVVGRRGGRGGRLAALSRSRRGSRWQHDGLRTAAFARLAGPSLREDPGEPVRPCTAPATRRRGSRAGPGQGPRARSGLRPMQTGYGQSRPPLLSSSRRSHPAHLLPGRRRWTPAISPDQGGDE
jgi:hypothetical protein